MTAEHRRSFVLAVVHTRRVREEILLDEEHTGERSVLVEVLDHIVHVVELNGDRERGKTRRRRGEGWLGRLT